MVRAILTESSAVHFSVFMGNIILGFAILFACLTTCDWT